MVKKKINQTRSLRAAAQPDVSAMLAQLKRDWRSRTAEQRTTAIKDLRSKRMSNRAIGRALGLSEAAIRRYLEPKEETQSTEQKHWSRDKSRRLAAAIVSFLEGRNGAPAIRRQDIPDVVTQAEIRFSSERYEPVQKYLPEKVSVAGIIRRTMPKPVAEPFRQWELGYYADWLASIMISMSEDRNIRVKALQCAATKIEMTRDPKQLFTSRSVPCPQSAPDWDDLNEFEREFRLWRWMHS